MKNEFQRELWEPLNEEKETVTHYLNTTTMDLIADFIHTTKKSLPLNKRKKINRSLLINIVITEVMLENQRFGSESFLFRIIEEWKNN